MTLCSILLLLLPFVFFRGRGIEQSGSPLSNATAEPIVKKPLPDADERGFPPSLSPSLPHRCFISLSPPFRRQNRKIILKNKILPESIDQSSLPPPSPSPVDTCTWQPGPLFPPYTLLGTFRKKTWEKTFALGTGGGKGKEGAD